MKGFILLVTPGHALTIPFSQSIYMFVIMLLHIVVISFDLFWYVVKVMIKPWIYSDQDLSRPLLNCGIYVLIHVPEGYRYKQAPRL